MKTVHVNLGDRSYDIRIARGLLGCADELLPWITGNQVVIVTNTVIADLRYLSQVEACLENKQVFRIVLPDGEQTKNLKTLDSIIDQLLRIPCDRKVTLIALGGGVIGDMGGFAAACYQRGVPFIQIPTTLLAQVDSSVGGKTAVNHSRGKNMIGAFYQPRRVIADLDTLSTLSDREFASGVAEVIKYGLINDLSFFEWLEKNITSVMRRESASLEFIIAHSCISKANIVEQDEKEAGKRALLNLGHTFGHAIETGIGYGTWLHGEAVAMGMMMAADLSTRLGWLEEKERQRIKAVLTRASLPSDPFSGLDQQVMIELMKRDKKVQDGSLKLVLLQGIGEAVVTDCYSASALRDTVKFYTAS